MAPAVLHYLRYFRTQLLVCQTESGSLIIIPAVPTDVDFQLSTRDSIVGIVDIMGGRSGTDADYVIGHLFSSSLGSVTSDDYVEHYIDKKSLSIFSFDLIRQEVVTLPMTGDNYFVMLSSLKFYFWVMLQLDDASDGNSI